MYTLNSKQSSVIATRLASDIIYNLFDFIKHCMDIVVNVLPHFVKMLLLFHFVNVSYHIINHIHKSTMDNNRLNQTNWGTA